MSIQSGALMMGRKQAEALMESACTITRVTGKALNETTGQMQDTLTTIYSGPCRLRAQSARIQQLDSVGQELAADRQVLSLPVGAAGSANVKADDVATVTGNTSDVGLVGVRCRVMAFSAQTAATARRFTVEVLY